MITLDDFLKKPVETPAVSVEAPVEAPVEDLILATVTKFSIKWVPKRGWEIKANNGFFLTVIKDDWPRLSNGQLETKEINELMKASIPSSAFIDWVRDYMASHPKLQG
ncbi:MAG TPA: hypothetical protein VKM55_01005 [Candidatus Lokiarchaeia archaeon]|nr:hypothetical protein [Candidatus Lokiarchaeia archaeon]